MQAWSKRLNDVLQQRGWTQSELAQRAGVSRENVKKYCQGHVSQPRGDTLPRLAAALDVHGAWLRDGTGPQWRRVQLIGLVQGGGHFLARKSSPREKTPSQSLIFEIAGKDPVAIEIQDDSLEPVYRSGDRLLCARTAIGNTAAFLDRECLVQLTSGKGYVARVRAGSRPGCFSLALANGLTIADAELAWAAPVVWVKRGSP